MILKFILVGWMDNGDFCPCIKICKYLLLRTFYRMLDFNIQLNI